jgi:sugar lactone lactonase YvrE
VRNLHDTHRSIFALGLLILAIAACRSTNEPSAPSWAKAKVLSDKEDHPSKIVSDGDAVYFVTGGTIASQHEGTNNIKRISLNDGAVSILVKGDKLIPEPALALDDKYLYWSDGGNIYRLPKTGGASEKIIPNAPQPTDMVLDDENIYWLIWTGEGSPPAPLMVAPKNGGKARQLTPPQPPTTGICLDGKFIYWMTSEGLRKIPTSGGEIVTVFAKDSGGIDGLAQDEDNFYFIEHDGGKSELRRLNKKTGDVAGIAPSANYTMEFVVDNANVYFFDDVRGQGSFGPVALLKVAKNESRDVLSITPTVIDQGTAGWIKHLAVDGGHVYFTDISKVYALPN